MPIPSGFTLFASHPGVEVYKKNYRGGQPDYVTIIQFPLGGLKQFTGTATGSPSGSARVTRASFRTAPTWWNTIQHQLPTSHVVINGTFFNTNTSPTQISFGLRVQSQTISYGYGLNEYVGKARMFVFDTACTACDIIPWNGVEFGRQENIIGTLDITADKSARLEIARTMLGVADRRPSRGYAKALFFSSAFSTQAAAASVLQAFGAEKCALLDSGGSSAFCLNGSLLVSPIRSVPHVLTAFSK